MAKNDFAALAEPIARTTSVPSTSNGPVTPLPSGDPPQAPLGIVAASSAPPLPDRALKPERTREGGPSPTPRAVAAPSNGQAEVSTPPVLIAVEVCDRVVDGGRSNGVSSAVGHAALASEHAASVVGPRDGASGRAGVDTSAAEAVGNDVDGHLSYGVIANDGAHEAAGVAVKQSSMAQQANTAGAAEVSSGNDDPTGSDDAAPRTSRVVLPGVVLPAAAAAYLAIEDDEYDSDLQLAWELAQQELARQAPAPAPTPAPAPAPAQDLPAIEPQRSADVPIRGVFFSAFFWWFFAFCGVSLSLLLVLLRFFNVLWMLTYSNSVVRNDSSC